MRSVGEQYKRTLNCSKYLSTTIYYMYNYKPIIIELFQLYHYYNNLNNINGNLQVSAYT